MKILTYSFLIYTITLNSLSSQCSPPMAETCEEALMICSLDKLNGYSCNNPSSVPSSCSPLCSGGGVGHNTSWWAFACGGGEVCITLTIEGCTMDQGLQFGIWADCSCGEEVVCSSIPCAAPNSSTTIKAQLEPCKTYFLWVDGCSGDVCDFTINIPPGGPSGGPPGLSDIGTINNLKKADTIDICVGACQIPFFISEQPNGCSPSYAWTCHGMPVGGNEREIFLDFPKEGDFEICVTALIGNPSNGSICTQTETVCLLVRVRQLNERIGSPISLCWEQVHPGGYHWHDQVITKSGVYRQKFMDSNCCSFDSVMEFIVLEKTWKPEVYFISLNRQPYVDFLGRSHYPCKDKVEIILPGLTQPSRCDSSIYLTVINIEPRISWHANCFDNRVKLFSEISFENTCSLGESIELEYRWFLKNDALGLTINTGPSLIVDAINEDYCVEVKYKVSLGNVSRVWTEVYCDDIEEITIKSSTKNISMSACDSIIYDGIIYYESTRIIDQVLNASGCENRILTDLNIRKSSSSILQIKSCDSAIINGVIYYESGNYIQNLVNTNHCDSMVYLDLHINSSNKNRITIESCDSVIYGNHKYTESGEYSQILQNIDGCDSIILLDLKIKRSNESLVKLDGCDSIMINGSIYRESGHYIQHLSNVSECDSILHLDLTVNAVNRTVLEAGRDSSICEGQFIELSGVFSGTADFLWSGSKGYFENADRLSAKYYPSITGVNRIFLEASDECNYWIDSLDLLILPIQKINIIGDSVLQSCKDNFLTATGASHYYWIPQDLVKCLDKECSKVLLKLIRENTILSVRSAGTCIVPANINLRADQMETDLFIPNVFTPNGDNVNDEFYPVITADQIHNYDMNIYDRWGTIIFETSERQSGWNGNFRNEKALPGVYTYVIQYENCEKGKIVKSGNVTLIR